MREDSLWEMSVCEYCFERMHHSQIEEHKNLLHREVMDAEGIVKGLADHEKKGLVAIGVWLGLLTIIAFVLVQLEVEASMPYVLVVSGVFIGIGAIALAVHFSTPEQVREARRKAQDVLSSRMVRCEVCDSMVAYEDYSGHIRQYHPKKMPYEWYRAAILALLVLVGGGGYVAMSLLAEMEMFSDEQGILFVIGWIGGSCLILLWMLYEYHVGEVRHIERMRRYWTDHRFDPKGDKGE